MKNVLNGLGLGRREKGVFNEPVPKIWDFFSITPRGLKITEGGSTVPRFHLGI
jgi:hypothetical protein